MTRSIQLLILDEKRMVIYNREKMVWVSDVDSFRLILVYLYFLFVAGLYFAFLLDQVLVRVGFIAIQLFD